MIGYKIEYGEVGHDCWGARDFFWIGAWDDTVYLDKAYCEAIMENLAKEYQDDKEFRIKEVEIK